MMTLVTLMTLPCSRSDMPSLASFPSYGKFTGIATLYRHLTKRNNIRVSPRVLPLWTAGGLSIRVASIGYVSPVGDSARDNSRGTAICGNTGRGSCPCNPYQLSSIQLGITKYVQEGKYYMANRQRNLGINIRVTPEEKKNIERNARKCRLNVSEYLRQIAMKVVPKELPAKEIEESFLRINEVIGAVSDMKRRSSDPVTQRFCDDIYADLLRIMVETLQLMRHICPKPEVKADGND